LQDAVDVVEDDLMIAGPDDAFHVWIDPLSGARNVQLHFLQEQVQNAQSGGSGELANGSRQDLANDAKEL